MPGHVEQAGGTGRGLGLVKQIAEPHHGRVLRVRSGGGNCFVLELPAAYELPPESLARVMARRPRHPPRPQHVCADRLSTFRYGQQFVSQLATLFFPQRSEYAGSTRRVRMRPVDVHRISITCDMASLNQVAGKLTPLDVTPSLIASWIDEPLPEDRATARELMTVLEANPWSLSSGQAWNRHGFPTIHIVSRDQRWILIRMSRGTDIEKVADLSQSFHNSWGTGQISDLDSDL
jgi:hypothetical protein